MGSGSGSLYVPGLGGAELAMGTRAMSQPRGLLSHGDLTGAVLHRRVMP